MARPIKNKPDHFQLPANRLLASGRPFRLIQILIAVVAVAVFGFALRNRYFSHAANGYPITITITTNLGTSIYGFYSTNHTFGTCNNGSAAGGTGATYSSFTAPIDCNGYSFGNSTSDPVYLYAPAVSGYSFSSWSWTGGIGGYVDCSRNPCLFAVPNGNAGSGTLTANYISNAPPPPPPPGVSLSAATGSVPYGGSTTLSWSSNNNPSSCYGSGGNFSGPHNGSGSQSTGSLSSTTTYSLTCSNAGGSNTASASVAVGPRPAPPAPTPNPTPAPVAPPPPNTPAPGGGNNTPPTSNPGSSVPSGGSPATSTSVPNTPSNFAAATNNNSSIVSLNWTPVSGINSYTIERSTDNASWQPLSTSQGSAYQDTSTLFNIHYYYRLAAVDNSGTKSSFALADITTPQFSGNSSSSSDTTIKSDDGVVSATIPAAAFTADASCNIVSSTDQNDGLPTSKTVKLIAGPYSIICQLANGDTVAGFQKPINIVVNLSSDNLKHNTNFRFYHFDVNSSKWALFTPAFMRKQNQYAFSTTSPVKFIVTGSKKSGFPWGIIIGLLLTFALLAAILFIIIKRGQNSQYQDYMRRKYYDL